MAHCGKCNKDVGCGCNLMDGLCVSCYSEEKLLLGEVTPKKYKSTKKIVYKKAVNPNPPATSGFTEILKMKGISREDKIKRINEILEKAVKDNTP